MDVQLGTSSFPSNFFLDESMKLMIVIAVRTISICLIDYFLLIFQATEGQIRNGKHEQMDFYF